MARTPGIVQINQYQQRTNPSGPARPKSRPQQLPDAFGGMLDGIADGGAAVARVMADREEDDARAYSARAVAEATNRYAERAAEIEANAADGWRNLTRDSNAAWETIDQEYIDNAPSERAREYLSQHLPLLRTQMVGRQAERERDLRREWRRDQFDATTGLWETTLLRDPTQWARAHATITQTVGQSKDISANERRDLLTRYQQSVAGFAVTGMIQRDPEGTLRQLRGGGANASADTIASLIGGTITSTQRSPEENARVGGVANSMHLTGEAVDLTVPTNYQGMSRAAIETDVRRRLAEGGVSASEVIFEGDHIHIGWRGAEGGSSSAPDPNSPVAFLSAEQNVRAQAAAEAEINRRQAEVNSTIRERETLTRALWDSGEQAVDPPTVEEVRAARGDVAAAEYEAHMMTFNATSSMQDLTNTQLTQIAVRGPMAEGSEQERLRNAAERSAAAALLEQRADPMAYIARRTGNIDTAGMADAMQRGDWREIGRRLRTRQAIAAEYGRRFEMSASPVTRGEAQSFRALLDNVRAQDRQAAFAHVRENLSDPAAYMNFARMVYPDSPGAQLGMMVAGRRATLEGAPNVTTEVASRRLIDGAIALGSVSQQNTPSEQGADRARATFAMPSDADLRRAWIDQVGNAYRGMPQSEAAAFEAFRAAYAGTAMEAGDASGVFNNRFAREAAAIASGGIMDRGGGQTVLPWGMSERDFDASIARGWNTIRERNGGDINGRNAQSFQYMAIGAGRYAVMTRQGAPARNRNGDPITIRIPSR